MHVERGALKISFKKHICFFLDAVRSHKHTLLESLCNPFRVEIILLCLDKQIAESSSRLFFIFYGRH